jgi:ABC-type uncharacterized transport system ATPase subunit
MLVIPRRNPSFRGKKKYPLNKRGKEKAPPMPLLQATALSHSYGTFHALTPCDLSLNAGKISVLEGPNGSGKSTLLLCLK